MNPIFSSAAHQCCNHYWNIFFNSGCNKPTENIGNSCNHVQTSNILFYTKNRISYCPYIVLLTTYEVYVYSIRKTKAVISKSAIWHTEILYICDFGWRVCWGTGSKFEGRMRLRNSLSQRTANKYLRHLTPVSVFWTLPCTRG